MDNPPADDLQGPFQFTLFGLLAAMTAFALVTGLTVTFKMPEILATALVAYASCLTWRITKANLIAIILWFIASELIFIAVYFGRTAIGYEILEFTLTCLIFSILVYLTSSIIFFYAGIKTNKKKSNIVCGCLVILTPFIIFSCMNEFNQIKDVYESAENKPIMQNILEDVETIHKRLGRVPNDEYEIFDLHKKPLPCINLRGQVLLMHYKRIDSDNYKIWFQNVTDVGNVYIFTYDSRKPECGWIRSGTP
jgi:hypothetical protein